MLFPKSRMRFTSSYQGKNGSPGWIVLDLTGADLDGVGKIYLPAEQVQKLIADGDLAGDKLKAARMLLGGNAEQEDDADIES
jgi:hypothetical protein